MIEYYPKIDSTDNSDSERQPYGADSSCEVKIGNFLVKLSTEKLAAMTTPLEETPPPAQTMNDIYWGDKNSPEHTYIGRF
jgi:hypothetical protein